MGGSKASSTSEVGNGLPRCGCNETMKLLVSKSIENPGRKFWKCRNSMNGCGLFLWDDLVSEFAVKETNPSGCRQCEVNKAYLIEFAKEIVEEIDCRVGKLNKLADDKLVLASLEQYVLLNSSDFHDWTTDNLTVTRLVNLYSLLRGLGNMNYQIYYSQEAEEIIFQLINNGKWDLLSARIHTVSLKWLFQQENITESLCHQILKFCRNYNLEGDAMIIGNSNQTVNVQTLAELASIEELASNGKWHPLKVSN
ncbi:hypothetical protein KIW84_062006 [Lathyrus oleraceus]|uniref:GRF-type domain-containing protein n=1 Tax=Pisum sativum TaxID=3888 RepID=A0A9D4W5S6_PEA|nr:hypothetical protein KIW84_062006 [Pisum sativum]